MRSLPPLLALVLGASPVVVAQDAGQFFESAGVPIYYVDQGAGEPVVLMHGLNGSHQRWFESGFAQKLLDAGYRVLALDARAHGKSGTPHDPAQYGPEMALDIARLLTHLELERAHVVGYSMGGNIAGKLRAMEPARLITLTLGGSGWIREPGPSQNNLSLADSLERGEGFMPLYRDLYPDWSDEDRKARSAEMVARLPDVQATVAMYRGRNFAVTEESLRENTVPTLAVIGEADPRKTRVDALQGVMKELEVVVVPGADHRATFEHPDFSASVLEFLGKHPEERPSDEAGADTLPERAYDQPPSLIEMEQPIYPREAFTKGVEGTVVLEIWISVDGRVVRVRVLNSIPLLDAAAIDCVKRWRFEPAVKDGQPVMVAARAPVTFRIYEKK